MFEKNITVREPHFALAAELRSNGKFAATIDDMSPGGVAISAKPLIPDLTLPLSTEFIFDINATEQLVVSHQSSQ
jgi:hypothetical protein